MLQRVSFRVDREEREGILHLPGATARGGVVVLPDAGWPIDDPALVAACEALAGSGVVALRAELSPAATTSLDQALAEAARAVRLVRAHPALRGGSTGIVGTGYGAAVAAMVAGRDSRIRVVALVAPRAEAAGQRRPLPEVTRTRARVLIVRAEGDDTDRYVPVLSQARVTHRVVDGPAPAAIADWMVESL